MEYRFQKIASGLNGKLILGKPDIKYKFIKKVIEVTYAEVAPKKTKAEILATKFKFQDENYSKMYEMVMDEKVESALLFEYKIEGDLSDAEIPEKVSSILSQSKVTKLIVYIKFMGQDFNDDVGRKIRSAIPLPPSDSPITFTIDTKAARKKSVYLCIFAFNE